MGNPKGRFSRSLFDYDLVRIEKQNKREGADLIIFDDN